jgi:hypothetical protein
MRALTIHQPFASYIIEGGRGWAGAKDVENRRWSCTYKGILLIHAGRNLEYVNDEDEREDYESYRDEHPDLPLIDTLPIGKIIGAVTMYGCYRSSKRKQQSDWEYGPYCFKLKDPVAFTNPIPATGKQGLWVPDNSIIKRVNDLLKGDDTCPLFQSPTE